MKKTHREDKTFGRDIMSENKIPHRPYKMSSKNWGEPEGREKLLGSGKKSARSEGTPEA